MGARAPRRLRLGPAARLRNRPVPRMRARRWVRWPENWQAAGNGRREAATKSVTWWVSRYPRDSRCGPVALSLRPGNSRDLCRKSDSQSYLGLPALSTGSGSLPSTRLTPRHSHIHRIESIEDAALEHATRRVRRAPGRAPAQRQGRPQRLGAVDLQVRVLRTHRSSRASRNGRHGEERRNSRAPACGECRGDELGEDHRVILGILRGRVRVSKRRCPTCSTSAPGARDNTCTLH